MLGDFQGFGRQLILIVLSICFGQSLSERNQLTKYALPLLATVPVWSVLMKSNDAIGVQRLIVYQIYRCIPTLGKILCHIILHRGVAC